MKELFKIIINFFEKLLNKKHCDDGEISINTENNNIGDENSNNNSSNSITIQQTMNSDIKILIDNGHGYNTPGKRSPFSSHGTKPEIEFYEYKWNREIAKPIVEELKNRGYDAELVVPEESDISLSERVNRCNRICSQIGSSKVIFISIHSNAAGNGKEWYSAHGWSAYTSKGNTKSDTIAEYLYKEAEKNFKGRKIRKDTSDGDSDWEENFTVLAKTKCPSVLTENFFYDNVDDVKYILSEEGREMVIKTHVDGIINYIESLKK